MLLEGKLCLELYLAADSTEHSPHLFGPRNPNFVLQFITAIIDRHTILLNVQCEMITNFSHYTQRYKSRYSNSVHFERWIRAFTNVNR
jgi:hypothetical protein